MTGRVGGKVAMVTGAAGGIGAAVARRFAAEGARVVLADLDEAAMAGLRDELSGTGPEILCVRLDVRDEGAWQAAVAQTEEKFGALDILVNNAGIAAPAPSVFEDVTFAQWRRVMDVNLDGTFLGLRTAIPLMRRKGGGSIVNIGSVAAYIGTPGGPAYGSGKGGVRTLTKQAAVLCARNGDRVRINAVHPCYVWTPLAQAGAVARWGADQAKERLAAMHPFGVLAEPEDVAAIVLFIASDEARLINGADIVADGGLLAQ
jgi:NAD(P)-dependent dehydrogenase (short-subunit alcohol dehydrogenase family)